MAEAESSYIDAWFLAAKAGRSDDLQNLVPSVGNINQADHLGNTALHYAASAGHITAVDVLLQAKTNPPIDINIKNSTGDTPLHKAAWRNSTEVVHRLVAAGADLFASNHDKQRPIDLARDHSIIAELSPPIPDDGGEEEDEKDKESDDEDDEEDN